KINLSVKDLPANVEGKFSQQGGYPDFTSNLMLDFMFQPPGVYPIKVMATPEGGVAKEYTVKLTVDSMDEKECNAVLQGSLRVQGAKFQSNIYDSIYISQAFQLFSNQMDGGVYFRNLPLYTDSVA